jgi:hypothetical protein
MKIEIFPKHLFWSHSQEADLPVELVVEQVILYGDLEDLFRLSDMVSPHIISRINRRIATKGRWLKRCYFVDKVILG